MRELNKEEWNNTVDNKCKNWYYVFNFENLCLFCKTKKTKGSCPRLDLCSYVAIFRPEFLTPQTKLLLYTMM